MKTTILHLMSLLVILSFSGSCGKKDEKKSAAYQNTNLALPANIGAQSLQDWYNNPGVIGTFPIPTISSRYPGLDKFTEVRMKRTFTENCSKDPVKLFGLDIGDFQFCNQGTPRAFPLSETTIQALPNVSKASFPRLAAVMNGSLGQIINVQKPEYIDATFYAVDIRKPNGAYIKAIIDVNVHPAFNPVSIFDSETKVEEFVSNIKAPF